eukprot:scaffold19603_cov18-Prasinocladus_malaysianus.AAC.1
MMHTNIVLQGTHRHFLSGLINLQLLMPCLLCHCRTHTDLADGRWHMLTVTTHPTQGKGYRVYVDGVLSGMLGPGAQSLKPVHATAGGKITLGGSVSLCGRLDGHPQRHFPGRIASLGFWNM